jgi:hypothetical protein
MMEVTSAPTRDSERGDEGLLGPLELVEEGTAPFLNECRRVGTTDFDACGDPDEGSPRKIGGGSMVVLVLVSASFGQALTDAAAPDGAGAWDQLSDVARLGSDDVWVVGNTADYPGRRNAWRRTGTAPGGTSRPHANGSLDDTRLTGLAALSGTEMYAVGYTSFDSFSAPESLTSCSGTTARIGGACARRTRRATTTGSTTSRSPTRATAGPSASRCRRAAATRSS